MEKVSRVKIGYPPSSAARQPPIELQSDWSEDSGGYCVGSILLLILLAVVGWFKAVAWLWFDLRGLSEDIQHLLGAPAYGTAANV